MLGVLAFAQTAAIAALAADIAHSISHPRSFAAVPAPTPEPRASSPSPSPITPPSPSLVHNSLPPPESCVPGPSSATASSTPPRIVTSLPLPSPSPIAPRSPGPVVREKLAALRCQADEAGDRHQKSELRTKGLELTKLQSEQHIASLQHRIRLLESRLEAAQSRLASELSGQKSPDRSSCAALDIQAAKLEASADEAQSRLRKTAQRLWSTTVRVEGQERKLVSLQQECNKWRSLYETVEAKFLASKEELEKVVQQMT